MVLLLLTFNWASLLDLSPLPVYLWFYQLGYFEVAIYDIVRHSFSFSLILYFVAQGTNRCSQASHRGDESKLNIFLL